MKKWNSRVLWLIGAITSTIILLVGMFLYPPTYTFSLLGISLPIIPLFFLLVFAAIGLLSSIILKNYKHGFLIATTVVVILLLRLFGFTNLVYPILLIILTAVLIKITR